ncbi:MAG: glycosyltransferase family 2 protein [Bacteroidota bacterium]
MEWILPILGYIWWLPVVITAGYLLLMALGGHLPVVRKKGEASPKKPLPKVALFVPAYKEDAVILDSVHNLLKMNYPRDRWDLVVIADRMQPETMQRLRTQPIVVVEMNVEKSTKAKAINTALKHLDTNYDIAAVLDADNHTEVSFLQDVATAFAQGAIAVQARRVAKNMDTPMAILDAMSEEANNHLFCKAHRRLGLSSRLIGSGMAFRYGLFHELMLANKAIGGFDKELELEIMKRGHKIEYLPETRVFDEKVSQPQTFKNQRLRWIAAQYHYLRRYFLLALWALITKGNTSFFDKAFQMLILPRMILIGMAGIGLLASLLLPFGPHIWIWLGTFMAIGFAYAFSIPKTYYNWSYLKAIFLLPKALFMMLWELRFLGSANKQFIHTPHGTTPKAEES